MSNDTLTTVKRKHIDGVAVVLLSAILLTGGVATWQAYQQWSSSNDMGGHVGMTAAVHGTNPVWYLFGTIVAVSIVGGVYLVARDQISSPTSTHTDTGPVSSDADREPIEDHPEQVTASDNVSDRRVLDLLPDDERRILEPVLDSPGLTQIELRDRSDFSKSKVSQTVTALEKRGLLYREPRGRTYRIYPSDDLDSDRSSTPD